MAIHARINSYLAAVLVLLAASAFNVSATWLRRLDASNTTRVGPYRPYCFVENGFDYEGKDIKNVPAASADSCCGECTKLEGCNAWSWTNYANGTCWLKSDRGRIIVNANVKSALLLEGPRSVCELRNNVDFVGNDIGRVASATAEGCCDICHNYLGCRAYTWNDYLGGSCWLKSSKGQAVVKAGAKSAEAYPMRVYEPVCALDDGVDYLGFDIGSQPSASPTGCCSICFAMVTCRVFTWTNHNGGTCWLKNLKGNTIKKEGAVSSVVSENLPYTCDIEDGFDYLGNDIANFLSTDPALCCTVCTEREDCKAYTWSTYNGGTCWLKSAKGSAVRNSQCKSGVPQRF